MAKSILNTFILFVVIAATVNSAFSQHIDSINLLIEKGQLEELSIEEYFDLSNYFQNNRQYSNGLIYSEKAINLCQKTKDTTNLVKAINLKAEHLIDLEEIEKGISFCENQSEIFRKQDSFELELLCFKWGMLYYLNKEYKKAYSIYRKIESEKYRKLYIYQINFSIIHAGLGDYDSASFYLKRVIDTENFENLGEKGTTYLNLGFYALNQKKNKEAIAYSDSAYLYKAKGIKHRGLRNLFTNYYYAYKGIKNIDKAHSMLDSIYKYNELIFQEKFEEEILELKNSYNREKSLKKKVSIIDDKIDQYEKRLLIWIPLILLVTVLILFWFFYRNLKAKKDLIILEQKLLRSQMTPHFIFNSLSVVQGMVLNNENEKGVKYLTKFSKLLRTILENSRDKLVNLNDELIAVQNYLDLQILQMENKLSYSINSNSIPDINSVLIPTMLIQPFVENSIEHGFKDKSDDYIVTLNLTIKNKSLIIEILDNGIGITKSNVDSKQNKKSLSTTISAERLQILSKEYKTKSNVEIINRDKQNEKGTKVILTIPYITEYD